MTQMVPRHISMSIHNRLLTKVPSGKAFETKIDSIPIAPRVRRTRERLPSSRCIKSDRRRPEPATNFSSAVASDTTLGLPGTYGDDMRFWIPSGLPDYSFRNLLELEIRLGSSRKRGLNLSKPAPPVIP